MDTLCVSQLSRQRCHTFHPLLQRDNSCELIWESYLSGVEGLGVSTVHPGLGPTAGVSPGGAGGALRRDRDEKLRPRRCRRWGVRGNTSPQHGAAVTLRLPAPPARGTPSGVPSKPSPAAAAHRNLRAGRRGFQPGRSRRTAVPGSGGNSVSLRRLQLPLPAAARGARSGGGAPAGGRGACGSSGPLPALNDVADAGGGGLVSGAGRDRGQGGRCGPWGAAAVRGERPAGLPACPASSDLGASAPNAVSV